MNKNKQTKPQPNEKKCICLIPFTCNTGLQSHCVNYHIMRKFWKNFGDLVSLIDGYFIFLILFLFLQINKKLGSTDQIVESLALHLCDTYFACCATAHMWIMTVFLLHDLKFSTMNFHYYHTKIQEFVPMHAYKVSWLTVRCAWVSNKLVNCGKSLTYL